jgi:hypothetical protein
MPRRPIKEYRCEVHGEFDAVKPVCPSGCRGRFVTREIRTAPGIKSGATKRADWALNALAEDHGYTDMNNSPSRANSVAEWVTRSGRKIKPMVERVPVQHAEPGFSRMENPEIPKVAPAQFGMQAEAATSVMIAGRRGRPIPTKQIIVPQGGRDKLPSI